MTFDNDTAPTITAIDAEARAQVQIDLDLHDSPVLAQRIADYMEHRFSQAHQCDVPWICEDCSVCDECGRGRD